jgi:phage shock protein A
MALITRISRLFTADVHAVLDRIEEPEVVLKQAVREMAEEVACAEQHLRWLDTEITQLQQRQEDAAVQIAAIDGELDLCFEAGEEDLARSLVRRKLVAQQHRQQAARQLESTEQDRNRLQERVAEQRQLLTDTQQKAELFADQQTRPPGPASETGISQDAVDVAFLKEQQRRRS